MGRAMVQESQENFSSSGITRLRPGGRDPPDTRCGSPRGGISRRGLRRHAHGVDQRCRRPIPGLHQTTGDHAQVSSRTRTAPWTWPGCPPGNAVAAQHPGAQIHFPRARRGAVPGIPAHRRRTARSRLSTWASRGESTYPRTATRRSLDRDGSGLRQPRPPWPGGSTKKRSARSYPRREQDRHRIRGNPGRNARHGSTRQPFRRRTWLVQPGHGVRRLSPCLKEPAGAARDGKRTQLSPAYMDTIDPMTTRESGLGDA